MKNIYLPPAVNEQLEPNLVPMRLAEFDLDQITVEAMFQYGVQTRMVKAKCDDLIMWRSMGYEDELYTDLQAARTRPSKESAHVAPEENASSIAKRIVRELSPDHFAALGTFTLAGDRVYAENPQIVEACTAPSGSIAAAVARNKHLNVAIANTEEGWRFTNRVGGLAAAGPPKDISTAYSEDPQSWLPLDSPYLYWGFGSNGSEVTPYAAVTAGHHVCLNIPVTDERPYRDTTANKAQVKHMLPFLVSELRFSGEGMAIPDLDSADGYRMLLGQKAMTTGLDQSGNTRGTHEGVDKPIYCTRPETLNGNSSEYSNHIWPDQRQQRMHIVPLDPAQCYEPKATQAAMLRAGSDMYVAGVDMSDFELVDAVADLHRLNNSPGKPSMINTRGFGLISDAELQIRLIHQALAFYAKIGMGSPEQIHLLKTRLYRAHQVEAGDMNGLMAGGVGHAVKQHLFRRKAQKGHDQSSSPADIYTAVAGVDADWSRYKLSDHDGLPYSTAWRSQPKFHDPLGLDRLYPDLESTNEDEGPAEAWRWAARQLMKTAAGSPGNSRSSHWDQLGDGLLVISPMGDVAIPNPDSYGINPSTLGSSVVQHYTALINRSLYESRDEVG